MRQFEKFSGHQERLRQGPGGHEEISLYLEVKETSASGTMGLGEGTLAANKVKVRRVL